MTTDKTMTAQDLEEITLKCQTMEQMLQIIADTADKAGKACRAWQARQAIHNIREGLKRAEKEDFDTAASYLEEARGYIHRLGQGARA